jgi:hypothetical protein
VVPRLDSPITCEMLIELPPPPETDILDDEAESVPPPRGRWGMRGVQGWTSGDGDGGRVSFVFE